MIEKLLLQNSCEREYVEWTNTWIENATSVQVRRILLIGGSCAREFRSSLNKLLPNYAVDFIGASCSLEDEALYNLCEMFKKNSPFSYDFILLNIGGKHGYYLHTSANLSDKNRFETALELFLNYLKNISPHIVFLTSTPTVRADKLNKLDEKINQEIISRNAIQNIVAEKFGYPLIDLYSFVLNHHFKYRDTQHFLNKKYQLMLAQHLLQQLVALHLLPSQSSVHKKTKNCFIFIELFPANKLKIKYMGGIFKIVRDKFLIKYYLLGFCIKSRLRKLNNG